ncbi:MAG TPA: hypothetical protein V6D11_07100 [Waterburya sp.]
MIRNLISNLCQLAIAHKLQLALSLRSRDGKDRAKQVSQFGY